MLVNGRSLVIPPSMVEVTGPAEVPFLEVLLVMQVLLEATSGFDADVYQTFWLWHVDFRDIAHRACMLRELAV